ncbi:sterol desaturase family protein [Massilia sp. IC2-476]|uniref:sterol desaturase family protein n=1 Tax=Massilia sp. IC2-476 TaxID=2887199 RepID=UPI001D0F8E98|nr:sterol desaturase family protein [Massilia sp. IC2-476]MCC2971127.1 sterol desaturase family protein [Massilia sp. IC2-476]
MEYLTQAGHNMLDYGWRILYVSMILCVLELIIGWNKYSLKSRLRGAMLWTVYIVITVAFLTAFTSFWGKLGIQPLVSITLSEYFASENKVLTVLGWIVAPLLSLLVSDFFYYWFHRAQHTWKFLWVFHAEHHAIREMSAWNSNHHWTEEIFRIPFMIIPMSLLVRVDPGFVPVLAWLLLGAQGQYIHSHTKLSLGPLRYIVADNRFHRIHHSVEKHHWNRNFGSFSSFWDLVFRTAHFPKRNEWPDTGLDEYDEAQNVREYLFRPFQKLRSKP